MPRRSPVFSTCWNGGDPGPVGCPGLDRHRRHRYAPQHEGPGALGVEGVRARSARRRSVRVPRTARRSDQMPLARRPRAVAVRQKIRTRPLPWADIDSWRRGDHPRPARLFSGRDRLAPSAADLAPRCGGVTQARLVYSCAHLTGRRVGFDSLHDPGWLFPAG